ncbi:hypothetical protein U9M48_011919 [Paspalum notatum var. saurae]|uniref:Reverse transcriptase n=1 Tax=Paspalum notatum var. saurae TaxID=547442 RepID=A0AAQ3SYT9_PASNO
MAQDAERWEQMMDNFDLLFSRVNDIGVAQQQLKAQVELTGQAVAKLTTDQSETSSVSSESTTTSKKFDNGVFADATNRSKQDVPKYQGKESAHRPFLPKMQFPTFDGSGPKVWIDKCLNYFNIYDIPATMWVTAASMHLQGNAAKWWQSAKKEQKLNSWLTFCLALEQRFGQDDYRNALSELLTLQQTGTVEEYTTAFEALQFEVCLHNSTYDDLFFVSKFMAGLKDDIRLVVEAQLPPTVSRASVIAKIQQRLLENQRLKQTKGVSSSKPGLPGTKPEAKLQTQAQPLWRERQLRDYRRNNGLCFQCGEKFGPGHMEVCSKRTKPQVNALAINDLDHQQELSDEVLNQLILEDDVADQFCSLSLHAISGTEGHACLKLRAIVNKKVMLILVDSGSSHSFINSAFVAKAGLSTIPAPPNQVKVASGHILTTDQMIPDLGWWCQGYTFHTSMRVLDIGAYDAILGFDWLQKHSPMQCDWATRTLNFSQQGQSIHLQGVPCPPLKLSAISGEQLSKWCSGNEVWALAVVNLSHSSSASSPVPTQIPTDVQTVLQQYHDIFEEPHTLPPSRVYDHHIPLEPNAVPVNCRPYKYSPQHKTEIERQVKELLDAGLITHSTSPFASPVLLVQKKDGSWRLYIDYRKLNALTIKNRFPMPVIEEILDELGTAKYFTKLDMRSGYHQIRMSPEDEYKTAFKTHHGHYQFKVMPFGLTNAPATFQCIMNEILSPFLRKFVLVFLDDILIFSPNLETHLSHLTLVLAKLRQHKLYLKPSKCTFAQQSVEYLGHIISDQGVSTDPAKTEVMLTWPRPPLLLNYEHSWGLLTIIGSYGVIAKPLTQLLRVKQFSWSDSAEQAFLNLKIAMSCTPVLAIPNFSQPFVVETDACADGIGAVLMQHGRPIAFLSKALGPSHSNYSIYEKEFLALIMAVDKWKQYLHFQEFVIRTDHKSLAYLSEQNLHSPLQRKAMARLMGLNFKIVYKQGKDNVAADALSRVAHLMHLQAVSATQPVWLQEVLNSYTTDPQAQQLLAQLAVSSPNAEGFSLEQGLIKHNNLIWIGNNSALRTKLIAVLHSSPIGGHSGSNATYYKIKKFFYWKGIKQDVATFVQQCQICQQAKHSLHHPFGLLQPLPLPEAAWQDISMDFVEGLPSSDHANAILVVVDRFTKFAHFLAIKHPYTAKGIAQLMLHGLPKTIVSDRDPVFISHFWQELFRLYGVQLQLSTSYHPQTDGQTERVNQSLKMYLRCAVHEFPHQWKKWLPLAELWYNSSYHTSLHCSPFKALYGYEPNLAGAPVNLNYTVQSVNDLIEERQQHLDILKRHLAAAQNRMKQYADQNRTEHSFQVGEQVLLKLQPYAQSSVINRPFPKLSLKYYGPYTVQEKVGAVAYRLNLPAGCSVHPVFHISQLKPYTPDFTPVYTDMPTIPDLDQPMVQPESILERRLVKRGNAAIPQLRHGKIIMWFELAFLLQVLGDKQTLQRGDLSQLQRKTLGVRLRYRMA